ncbi:MAG: hypothetical protein KAW66_01870 [Candidatus Lokiarchaeota archaeon]|jgi:hypothetical protein|nr:hypothetical protein [Candidatus Lokiarchaeota archaeon]
MDSIIYKVIFKAFEQFENKNLTLSFKDLGAKNPITIPAKFILELKNLSEKNDKVVYFQNIEEVIIVGNVKTNYSFNYYLVILFTSNGEKQGYLIGNIKKFGDIIIGVWPFNQQLSKMTPETIHKNYNNIIKNPNNFSKICLISQ